MWHWVFVNSQALKRFLYICQKAMVQEIWRPVEDCEGLYEVSNLGRVRSLRYRKIHILSPRRNYNGYLAVNLTNKKQHKVHRLVAFAFPEICGEWFPGAEVNHLDENPSNNNAENLRWVTHKENTNYGTRTKRAAAKCRNGKKAKKVYQYTVDGVFVDDYPSVREVERQLGYLNSNISSCASGKKETAYGYIWKYN